MKKKIEKKENIPSCMCFNRHFNNYKRSLQSEKLTFNGHDCPSPALNHKSPLFFFLQHIYPPLFKQNKICINCFFFRQPTNDVFWLTVHNQNFFSSIYVVAIFFYVVFFVSDGFSQSVIAM